MQYAQNSSKSLNIIEVLFFTWAFPTFFRTCAKQLDHFPLHCPVCWGCQGCLLNRHSLINLQSLTDTSLLHPQIWLAVHSNIIKHPNRQFFIIKHQSFSNISIQKWWVCASFWMIFPFAASLWLQEVYFHYMEPQARQAAVASASRGLCQAPVTDPKQLIFQTIRSLHGYYCCIPFATPSNFGDGFVGWWVWVMSDGITTYAYQLLQTRI